MIPLLLLTAPLALGVAIRQQRDISQTLAGQQSLPGLVVVVVWLPSLLSALLLLAIGADLLNLEQNYTLLLFIALQFALGSVWTLYCVLTEGTTDASRHLLWMMQALVPALIILALLSHPLF
ncbi:hypothetical protein [Shewanella sp. GXUN23E]|uniref:hypothetical protein n=1 Tax=Shewanella sp. GXUN23E TaxID=3422498 RepID=UPI003D7EF60C